jgi:hypothetical protein
MPNKITSKNEFFNMEILGFSINVLASLFAALIIFLISKYINNVLYFLRIGKSEKIRKVWAPFISNKTIVVMTGRKGVLPRSTIKVSFSEHQAVIELEKFFDKYRVEFKTLNSIEFNNDAYYDSNIILLGSKNANEVTEEFSRKRCLRPKIDYDNKGNLIVNKEIFKTNPDDGSPISEDYALVLKCDRNEKSKLMIIAGNHGAATEGAVKYVLSSLGFIKIAKELGNSNFMAIIKIKMKNNISHEYSLVEWEKFR